MDQSPFIATETMPNHRTITVQIHANDMITHAGLAHSVRQSPRLAEARLETAQEPDVHIVAVESADFSTLEHLKRLSPDGEGRFVLVVEKHWHADVAAAVEHGVRAMLWRNKFSPTAVAQAVVSVAEGDGILPPSLQGILMEQVQQVQREVLAPRGLTSSGFSRREIELLGLLSDGMDLEEVSDRMKYSERTVKNILYNAMKRHQLRNRTHAVSHAIRSGLI